jgi:prepilin-type processing-associated H-X9-DG protein
MTHQPIRLLSLRTVNLAILLCLWLAGVARAAAGPADEALWAEVVDRMTREQRAIKTLAVEWVSDERFSVPMESMGSPKGISAIHTEVSLLRSGEKYREESVRRMEGASETGGALTLHKVAAYDGRMARWREWRDKGKPSGLLLNSKSRGGVASPTSRLSLFPTEGFDSGRRNGELQLTGAEKADLNGKPTYKITFRHRTTGYVASVWYSIEEGMIPIKSMDVKPGGELFSDIVITDVTMVKDKDGNKFFYPMKGERRAFMHPGKVDGYTIRVNPGSVKVNQDIPEGEFRLEKLPGEKIHDIDRVQSWDNVRRLLEACRAYAEKHNGGWPEDFKAILEVAKQNGQRPANNSQVWRNPARPEMDPAYVYVKPDDVQASDARERLVLYEAHKDFDDGVNVGFADGHVEFIESKDRFNDLLVKASLQPPK